MNPADINPWLTLALSLIALAGVIYTWFTAGEKKALKEIETYKTANDEKIAKHDKRIQAVENELKHLPDRAMVHDLQLTLKDIQIELASVKAATEQATRTSQRVETYLLERSKEGGK